MLRMMESLGLSSHRDVDEALKAGMGPLNAEEKTARAAMLLVPPRSRLLLLAVLILLVVLCSLVEFAPTTADFAKFTHPPD